MRVSEARTKARDEHFRLVVSAAGEHCLAARRLLTTPSAKLADTSASVTDVSATRVPLAPGAWHHRKELK
ncbi:hypothetical protein BHS04_08735 [Myxococcus xanthus]|nr:hypothetical protein BHS04_08735 [Myxococcus xanthus]